MNTVLKYDKPHMTIPIPFPLNSPLREFTERRKMSPVEAHLQEQITTMALDVRNLKVGLADNSAVTDRIDTNTQELLEVFGAFKGAWKVLDVIGKLAKPVSFIVAFFSAAALAWHNFWGK